MGSFRIGVATVGLCKVAETTTRPLGETAHNRAPYGPKMVLHVLRDIVEPILLFLPLDIGPHMRRRYWALFAGGGRLRREVALHGIEVVEPPSHVDLALSALLYFFGGGTQLGCCVALCTCRSASVYKFGSDCAAPPSPLRTPTYDKSATPPRDPSDPDPTKGAASPAYPWSGINIATWNARALLTTDGVMHNRRWREVVRLARPAHVTCPQKKVSGSEREMRLVAATPGACVAMRVVEFRRTRCANSSQSGGKGRPQAHDNRPRASLLRPRTPISGQISVRSSSGLRAAPR